MDLPDRPPAARLVAMALSDAIDHQLDHPVRLGPGAGLPLAEVFAAIADELAAGAIVVLEGQAAAEHTRRAATRRGRSRPSLRE
jgi:hypothetical protein